MKIYEFRFANASTASKAPEGLSPPSKDPGWTVHSWQVVKVDDTPFKQGSGMHQQTTPASTRASLLVLWERDEPEER